MSAEPNTAEKESNLFFSCHECVSEMRRLMTALVEARKERDLALFQAQTNKETIERMMSVDEIRRYAGATGLWTEFRP